MPPFLFFDRLRKSFADHTVLTDISLGVEEGEILVLLGPSGSGKTTLLRLISGFETPDSGTLLVGGEDVTQLPPERRNFGMVFQHYALFPHMTVAGNIAFGLGSRKVPASDQQIRVREVLELVDLAGFEERRVQEISGGQQQRIALARALAPQPRLLLLDEPLSNLDPELRERTRRQLRDAIRRVGLTAVWVTHEQEEAFDVGDRVALLNRGALVQVGLPEELYLQPTSRFVAAFVGRASFLPGIQRSADEAVIGDERFRGHGVRWRATAAAGVRVNEAVEVMLRPEALEICSPDAESALQGSVDERRFTGDSTFYQINLAGGGRLLVKGQQQGPMIGQTVGIRLHPGGPSPRSFAAAEAIDPER